MLEIPAAATDLVMPVRMMPQDANPAGFVHGGVILKHIDLAGAMAAMRHCRSAVVTVSIDRMDFLAACNVGEALYFKSAVNFTGKTSMEVGVRVEAEDLFTGRVRHAASAYLTFVAVDAAGKPSAVPAVHPASLVERRRFAEAVQRRETRLSERTFERSSQAAPAPDIAPSSGLIASATSLPGGTGENCAANGGLEGASRLDGLDELASAAMPDKARGLQGLAGADGPVGPGKTPGESSLVMPVRMMPQDANPAGSVHGGVILKHIDLAGAMAAMRHCRSQVVTASIERMEFLGAARVGDMMTFKASLNRAGGCSVETGVRVETENLLTGEVRHAGSAYLTFTALDAAQEPRPVPPLLLTTPLELRRNAEALRRQETRHNERKREYASQKGSGLDQR